MRLNRVEESAPLGTEFHFYPIGDVHRGSLSCDIGNFRRTVKTIAEDEYARWLGMGDLVESIAPDDKRWSPKGVEQAAKDQQEAISDWYVEALCEMLAPIMDKCWGIADGNHEDKFNARYFTNINKRVLHEFGRDDLYGEWACATNVRFEDENNHRCSLKVYQQHGWQAGRKDGAKVNSLEDLTGHIVGCDIYLVAHSHSRFIHPYTKLRFNRAWTDEEEYRCYGAHTGCFLKTYEKNVAGYGEKKGYPPVSIGTVKFNIRTTEKGVDIEGVI